MRAAIAVAALFAAVTPAGPAAAARLRWEVHAGADPAGPVKLTITGVLGSRTPSLGPNRGRRLGDGAAEAWAAGNRIYSATGEGSVDLAAGWYEVVISRGPEWTIARQRVVLGPHGAEVIARLDRVVDTSGWLAADLHVHGAPSTDSAVALAARVLQLEADGVEIFVATDHNMVTEYGGVVPAGAAITPVRGDEITTSAWGHLVAFPLPAELAGKKRGEALARGHSGEEFIGAVRAVAPDSIIVAVHPHSRTSSYLGDGKLDAAADRARAGFSYDFDAMEILNGFNQGNFGAAIDHNLRTWFDLLDHGHLVAAVGDSDSHGLAVWGGQGGWPRTWVRSDEAAGAATPGALVAAIKARRAQLSTGPFVEASVGDAGIGDLAAIPDHRAHLHVSVSAAPWVPVDRVTIYLDGRIHEVVPVARSADPVRVAFDRTIEVAGDGYLVIRVDGPAGGLAPVAGGPRHRLPVLAITNPIFLDVGGDGRFDPPRPHGPHAAPAPSRVPATRIGSRRGHAKVPATRIGSRKGHAKVPATRIRSHRSPRPAVRAAPTGG